MLLSWVDRLGFRPIAAMTEAADAIRWRHARRVPPGRPALRPRGSATPSTR
jgi:two-component system OmpR family sensor kinase